MEITYKEILWALSALMIVIWYGKYIADTWKWKTTPHLFSWAIFFTMWLITFLIQYRDGAWPGAWGTLTACFTAWTILVLSLRQSEKNITKTDTISLILWVIAIWLYIIAKNPYYTVGLIVIIKIFAFYPTFRKTYYKPEEETLLAYVLAGIRNALSLFAMNNYSVLTLTNPIFLVIVNICFVSLVFIRKKQLK